MWYVCLDLPAIAIVSSASSFPGGRGGEGWVALKWPCFQITDYIQGIQILLHIVHTLPLVSKNS